MASEELAGGKLILDFPAEAVVRITISNPERRNALDHEILDTLAETLPRLDSGIENRCVLITGAPPVFSAGYDIGSIPEQTFERDAESLVAHPFHAAMEALAGPPLADGGDDQRALPRRRPRAGDHLRHADLRGGGETGNAAGQTRA